MGSRITFLAPLTADLAVNATTNIPYPNGYNQTNLTGTGRGQVAINDNEIFHQGIGVAFTFATSNIVIQNLSPLVWPAGTILRIGLSSTNPRGSNNVVLGSNAWEAASGAAPTLSAAQRANAQKVVNARLGYTARTVMSTPPTLSNSNDATTIGSSNNGASANSISLTDTTKIKGTGPFAFKNTGAQFLGIKGLWSQYGASDFNAGGSGWGFAFSLTGSVFELAISLSTARRIRMRVNGQWASSAHWSASNFGSPTVPDDFCVLKFTFSGSATRLIELFFGFDFGANGAWINIASGASVSLPVDAASEPLTRVWGDSFVEAPYVENTGYDTRETTPQALCEQLGVRDAAMAGRSSQGFVNLDPADNQTIGTRMVNNVALLPTRVHEIVEDTINDNAYTAAAVKAAVKTALQNLRTGAPDAAITHILPFTFDSNPTPPAIYAAKKAAVQEIMAVDAGIVMIETNDLPSINNGGTLPNGQTQVSFDGVHPGKAWSNYVAPILADRILAAWQAKLA